MAQRIDVPGMGVVEFPDGMSDGDIAAAIRKNMPAAAPAAPDEGMGQAMLIAAGRGTDKLAKGVTQLYYGAKSQFEPQTLSSLVTGMTPSQQILAKMKAEEDENDRLYQPLQEKFPVATAIGESAPALAAGVATGGQSLLAGAAAGALPSLLSYGTAEQRLKRGATDAIGGAGGVLLGKGVARLLKPAGSTAAGVSDAAIDAAERIGYQPTAGQITQNPGMQAFENYLLRSPGSSGAMQQVQQANQKALNRAGAKAMGETAEALDEGVFAAAQRRIGGEFDRLGQVTKPDLGGGFLTTLAKLDAENAARGSFASKKISELIDKGLDLAAHNNLSGQAYKEVRTELANQAQSAFKAGDATTGQAYKSLVASLDDAAKGSLSKADQKAWDAARKQWAAFKVLSKSNVAEAGNVSAPRAAAAVRAQGPGLRTGSAAGELADVARVGEAFKGVPNPGSGQLAQQMLYGNPITGVPMMLGNKAVASAYLSPLGQRYFSRGLLDLGAGGEALLTRTGGQLAIPATRGLLGVE